MDKNLVQQLVDEINIMVTSRATEEIKIMEVCGSHTQMIAKLGIKTLLSPRIKLLSGPGCPVCVTDEVYIDRAVEIARRYSVILATFGDLMRVKGTEGCLLDEKAKGKDIRIIYSPLDLIGMAESNKEKDIIFLGVGFETTAPVIALAIETAMKRGIKNLFFLTSIKLMPSIVHRILKEPQGGIHGLICPGHVASVKGADYFQFITTQYGVPAVVCGFEALDILVGVYDLVRQIRGYEKKNFKNRYTRCVRPAGNPTANRLMKEVFAVSHGDWRGIGGVGESALVINEKYSSFDGERHFDVENLPRKKITQCQCKDILLGNKSPRECKLYARQCNPQNPYGPCMVSTEGACAIAYRYMEGMEYEQSNSTAAW